MPPRRRPGQLEYLDDLEVVRGDEPEEDDEKEVPEPLRRVRVLPPFLVSHDGTSYWPQATPEVPESVAAHWILNGWVTNDIA